jgi:hypothetical protein
MNLCSIENSLSAKKGKRLSQSQKFVKSNKTEKAGKPFSKQKNKNLLNSFFNIKIG